MASGPISSWQTEGETMETVKDFKNQCGMVTVARCLLLGRKAMTNLESVLKGRDITLWTKVHLVKARAFPIVMYGCESWTIKKAEC